MSDYYEILGVSKNATKDEIKSAFRKFTRTEKRKMKQLGKNCNVLRLPCYDNCQKSPCETYKKPDCGCEKPKYNCEENKCKDDCNKAKCPSECNKPKCKSGYEAKKYYNYNSCLLVFLLYIIYRKCQTDILITVVFL